MPPAHDPNRREFLGVTGVIGAGLLAQRGAANEPVPLAPPDEQPPDLVVPEPPKKTLGWAIVGLGTLALGQILPAFGKCKLSRPVALVSGHADKAQQVAEVYGVKKESIYSYADFDRIAENREIDVVYIVLPNSMHAEYTIRAHRAGKHVLCEKPMAVTIEESERMIAAAEEAQRKLMIAYRLRYEPFNQAAIALLRKKELGDIRTISASNCQVVEAPNIRLSAELGGGPLGDIGVYCLNVTRYLTGMEPIEVTAKSFASNDPRFREVPTSLTFQLRFPEGILANCDCSFDAAESRRYRVHCTKGFVDLDPAFSYTGLAMHVKRSEPEEIADMQIQEVDHFAAEMDDFSRAILENGQTRTPGEEGLADMRIMAAIVQAAKSGQTVRVADVKSGSIIGAAS